MKNSNSHFSFNKQERSGIFFLLFIIVSLQVGYYFYENLFGVARPNSLVVDEEVQMQIDSLKQVTLQRDSLKLYPFNPNFITDYKGYILGMSSEEIDRLHAFRKLDKFANTKEDFQKITNISDSLLEAISPYFKFPQWTKEKKTSALVGTPSRAKKFSGSIDKEDAIENFEKFAIKDLNTATAEELSTINGIGEKLSARIVKFRERLGGFLIDDQLYDVYGLEPDVVERTFLKFRVQQRPSIKKINVNTASVYQVANLVYIQKSVAESIIEYRNVNNGILSLDELKNIEGFPYEKIDRIALYLSL